MITLKGSSIVLVTLGLCIGNFCAQAGGLGNYDSAMERSFFQIVSVIVVCMCARV